MQITDLEFKQRYFPDKLKFADENSKLFDLFAENGLDLHNFPTIVAEVILADPMRLNLRKGD